MKVLTEVWTSPQARRHSEFQIDQLIQEQLTLRSAQGWRLFAAYWFPVEGYAMPFHHLYFEKAIGDAQGDEHPQR